MHFLKILLFVIFTTSIYGQYDSLNHDGLWRKYLVHTPPSYNENSTTPYPLIIAMHGGFGNAFNMESQSQLSLLSDTSEVPLIVVYPEGVVSPFGITSWNAGECCGYSSTNNIDDVGFISSLLILLEDNYLIDTNMIYATGMSNGGMMSYRLAAELSEKFAAIAPVASTLAFEENLIPTNPIPIIHFHSFLDTNVPIEGGIGSGFSGYNNLPVDSILNVWAELNKCVINNDTVFNDSSAYLHKVWTNCEANKNIELYVTYDGGHSWPGGIRSRLDADPPSEKIDASQIMWNFFLENPKNKVTSSEILSSEIKKFKLFQNYPNPFNPSTTIRYSIPSFELHSNSANNVTIKVYNILGKEVAILANKKLINGYYEFIFNAADLPSGVYYYNLKNAEFSDTKKMLLIK